MTFKTTISIAAISLAIVGCATQPTPTRSDSAAAKPTASSNTRIVKSRNGAFDGEIVGTIAPRSRFAKLAIGMTMREVSDTIGAADDMVRHETGKRWIPFYYGNDAQRIRTMYKGEGCLTFTGGNIFGGGGNELIRITAAPNGGCLDS